MAGVVRTRSVGPGVRVRRPLAVDVDVAVVIVRSVDHVEHILRSRHHRADAHRMRRHQADDVGLHGDAQQRTAGRQAVGR